MISRFKHPQVDKNFLNKFLLGIALVAVCFGTSGCDLFGLSTSLSNNSGANSPAGQGTSSGASGSYASSYPVILDLSKTVQVGFTNADNKKNATLTYILIQNEVPISLGKLAEGDASCVDNRIKRYKTDCDEQFNAQVNNPQYDPQVKILRQNFRNINIVQNSKSEPAEVLFLRKINPETVGNGMEFFDVYLMQESISLLSKATDRNYAGQINLADVLSDCGQLQLIDNPEAVTETVQLGGNTGGVKTADEKSKKLPPDSLDPITQDKIQSIIRLNPSKQDLIEKSFDFTNGDSPFISGFTKTGTGLEQNHASFSEQIELDPSIFNIKAPDFFSSVSKITLTIVKANLKEQGSPLIQVEKDGKKYLYTPNIASKIVKVVPLPAIGNSQNLGITNVEFEPQVISSDPWCGFTPESKPAIYLYPTKPTVVLVKLNPQGGWISASDPKYSQSGWKVLAMPSGNIYSNFKKYPYLFYEAMLPAPQMSPNYEVFARENISSQLIALAKRLSLNNKESSELATYWTEKLPQAPFYKVGLLPENEIDRLEPLNISPAPDSIYRLRLLFEPIGQKISSTGIENRSFTRKGFTVVEWGGFVL